MHRPHQGEARRSPRRRLSRLNQDNFDCADGMRIADTALAWLFGEALASQTKMTQKNRDLARSIQDVRKRAG